jgi:hypothetical protein
VCGGPRYDNPNFSPMDAGSEPMSMDAGGPPVVVVDAGQSTPSCEQLAPVTSPPIMQFQIINQRPETVYLGSPVQCQSEYVQITSLTDPTLSWEGLHCKTACDVARNGIGGCTADCPAAIPLAIASGDSVTLTLDAVLYKQVPLPQQCCNNPTGACSNQCFLGVQVTVGEYSFVLQLVDSNGVPENRLESTIQIGTGIVTLTIA